MKKPSAVHTSILSAIKGAKPAEATGAQFESLVYLLRVDEIRGAVERLLIHPLRNTENRVIDSLAPENR